MVLLICQRTPSSLYRHRGLTFSESPLKYFRGCDQACPRPHLRPMAALEAFLSFHVYPWFLKVFFKGLAIHSNLLSLTGKTIWGSISVSLPLVPLKVANLLSQLTSKSPEKLFQLYSCRPFCLILETLSQWISWEGASQTVVLWPTCQMATWWTFSVLITPPAILFLQQQRGGSSPYSSLLFLLEPASSAPSPVPWSRPHKQLQGWLNIHQAPLL